MVAKITTIQLTVVGAVSDITDGGMTTFLFNSSPLIPCFRQWNNKAGLKQYTNFHLKLYEKFTKVNGKFNHNGTIALKHKPAEITTNDDKILND